MSTSSLRLLHSPIAMLRCLRTRVSSFFNLPQGTRRTTVTATVQ
jgi:hypothetical protein